MTVQNFFYELAPEELEYLDKCAEIRQCSRARLARELIRTIAKDQLVLSVLDDESKPMRETRRDARRFGSGRRPGPAKRVLTPRVCLHQTPFVQTEPTRRVCAPARPDQHVFRTRPIEELLSLPHDELTIAELRLRHEFESRAEGCPQPPAPDAPPSASEQPPPAHSYPRDPHATTAE